MTDRLKEFEEMSANNGETATTPLENSQETTLRLKNENQNCARRG